MVSHQKKQSRSKQLIGRATKPRPKPMKRKSVSRRSGKVAQQNARSARAAPSFGPVSTIDTAPVSIGNTVQGCSPIVTPTADGVRVRGRDFLVTANATSASVTGWCLIGGAPITPECMSASALKGYCSSYAEYQVHGVALHFVTSSTTADAGSVLLYVGKDRAAPGLNPTAANLLPFVLSDHCTVISPVWKNASAVYHPAPKWYTTGLGNDEPLSEQACGEMFVLSKVTETNSPGYILMDYDITFRNMQVNIKSLTFPLTRMKYTEVTLDFNAAMLSGVTTATFDVAASGVKLLDGVTGTAVPTGFALGDVYKLILTTTLDNLGGVGGNTLFTTVLGTTSTNFSLTDGLTIYAVAIGSSTVQLFPTYTSAIVASNPIKFGEGSGGTQNIDIHGFMSLVGAVEGAITQSNY